MRHYPADLAASMSDETPHATSDEVPWNPVATLWAVIVVALGAAFILHNPADVAATLLPTLIGK